MKKVNFWIIMLVLALFIFSGCQAAKKPATETPTTPMESQTVTDAKAKRIAKEADTVAGVKKSTVVTSGDKAYIGIDLDTNIV